MRRFLIYILLFPLIAFCTSQKEAVTPSDSRETETEPADTLSQQEILEAKTQYMQGIKSFEQENYEAALDHLTAAYVKMPDKAGINYALADAYFQMDDLANAAKYGKRATELSPRNKWYHLKLYKIYRSAGRNQATIRELNRILKYYPEDTEILERLARTYNEYGSPLKAIDVYNKILSMHGPDIRMHLKKFQTFKELGMRDSTLKELKQIRSLDPDNMTTLHTLSEFYLENDYSRRAKQTLQQALQRNPRNPQTLIMMAEAHMRENEWDSAGTMLQNIVTDSLIAPQGKMEVARFMYSRYKKQPDNQQIRRQTQQILTLITEHEPDLENGHALAADFFLETKQYDKALDRIEKTIELNPNNTAVWRERIRLLFVQNRYDRIIKLSSKADKHAPQDPFITFFIGSSHLVEQQYEEAVKWLSQASSLPAKKSFKSIVYGSLGDAHSSLEQWESADKAYEQALELDSTNHNAMNNFAYYLSKREKRLDYAKKLALRALELLPGNSSYLDTAGWVYYKLGDYEKALKYIEKAVNSGGASTTVLEHLGDVHQKLDNLKEARNWWQKAYQRDTTRTHLKRKIENHISD